MKKRKIVLALMMMLIGLGFSGFAFDSTSASAASYTASISTSGNINLDVSSAGNGANITTDNISIVSTCPSGYNVSIAAKSATNTSFSDTTLYKDGDKTNTADTKKINTSTGTIASPVSILGNNNKTWGYTTSDIMGGIDSVSINSNFVGLTNTQAIISTSSTNTPAEGTTLPVYYGVSVDNTIEPGLYKMSDDAVITYYLTTSLDCTSYQVVFNPTSTAGGQTLSGTGTMQNQRISEGVATALTANAFTAPTVSGTQYYFAGWNTAQDGTGTTYTNQQQVTDLTTVGNTITLYAQWTDCPANNVCYDPNGVSTPTTMGNQSIDADATSIDLWASNFQNEEYGFAGWSTEPIVIDNILRKTDIPTTTTVYGPNETITDADTINGIKTTGLKLYAIWIEYDWGGDMQSWAQTGRCSELNIGDITALMDGRDDQTYAVAKLADGKCWMIENLRLDNQYTTSAADIAKAQGYNSSFIGLANPETEHFSGSDTTANSLYSIDGSTSAPAITGNYQGYRFPRYNNQNTAFPATNMTAWSNSANTYSVGNWYTWSAAIADTSYYNTRNQTISGTSICPSGWHLPSGGDKNNFTSSEFWKLSRAAIGVDPANYERSTTPYYTGTTEGTNASNILRSYPNNFIYSGFFDGSSPYRGSSGRYWSSTVNSDGSSYRLSFYSSDVYPGTDYGYKFSGFSIRCVAGS